MNKINGISFNCLEEFNSFLRKTTQNQIQMEIDWDNNEWVWDKIGNEVTEFNILSVLSEYLKEEITDIITEINGCFGECKIILLIKDKKVCSTKNRKTNLDHIREMNDYDLADFLYDIARSNGRSLNLCDGCECKCSGFLPCDETERYYEYLYKEYDGE